MSRWRKRPASRRARAALRQVHGADAVASKRGGRTDGRGRADTPTSAHQRPRSGRSRSGSRDCLPILVVDRRDGAVAAAHAGWRGLASRVPSSQSSRIADEFGSRPADLIVAIGPSIGACCYEVGGDVRARFAQAGLARRDRGMVCVHPSVSAANPPIATLSRPGARSLVLRRLACACDQLSRRASARDSGSSIARRSAPSSHGRSAFCSVSTATWARRSGHGWSARHFDRVHCGVMPRRSA